MSSGERPSPTGSMGAHNPEPEPPNPVDRVRDSMLRSETPDPGARWMLELQAGDPAAFDRIVHEYQHVVHNLAYRFTGQRDAAEDLAQEVFLRVYRAKDRYRPEARFQTWLFRVVYNLCINETRARKLRRMRSIDAPAPGEEHDATLRESLADEQLRSPLDRLTGGEATRRLREAMAGLPPQQRAALTLYQYRGMSLREIADVLETTDKAVKSLLARARENLREKLAPYVQPSPENAPAVPKETR